MQTTQTSTNRSVAMTRIVAVVGSIVAAVAVFAIATGPLGLSLEVPQPGADSLVALTLPRVAGVSLLGALLAIGAAAIVTRVAHGSVRTFLTVGAVGLLVSFVPTMAIDGDASEKLALALMHVAVAGVSLTVLGRWMASRRLAG